jgi:sec-independent protein translocase protein TatA
MRLQIWHIVVLIIAFVLLFGWKNLPNAARSLGESMRVFKTEVDQMKDDGEARKQRQAGAGELPTADDRVDDRYQDSAQEEYRRSQQQGPDGDTPRG